MLFQANRKQRNKAKSILPDKCGLKAKVCRQEVASAIDATFVSGVFGRPFLVVFSHNQHANVHKQEPAVRIRTGAYAVEF